MLINNGMEYLRLGRIQSHRQRGQPRSPAVSEGLDNIPSKYLPSPSILSSNARTRSDQHPRQHPAAPNIQRGFTMLHIMSCRGGKLHEEEGKKRPPKPKRLSCPCLDFLSEVIAKTYAGT